MKTWAALFFSTQLSSCSLELFQQDAVGCIPCLLGWFAGAYLSPDTTGTVLVDGGINHI